MACLARILISWLAEQRPASSRVFSSVRNSQESAAASIDRYAISASRAPAARVLISRSRRIHLTTWSGAERLSTAKATFGSTAMTRTRIISATRIFMPILYVALARILLAGAIVRKFQPLISPTHFPRIQRLANLIPTPESASPQTAAPSSVHLAVIHFISLGSIALIHSIQL